MESQGGDQCIRCPCYKNAMDYQNIMDSKDAGRTINPQSTQNNYENDETDRIQPTKSNEEFLLHAVEEKVIICPRCKHIFQSALSLVKKSVPAVNKNDIMGICDHCRKKLFRSPCKHGDETVGKVRGKDEATDKHKSRECSKLRHILSEEVIKEKETLKQNRSLTHPEFNIDKLQPKSDVSLRQPEVTDLVYPEIFRTGSTRSHHMSDDAISDHAFPKMKKKTMFVDSVDREKKHLHIPNEDTRFYSKSQQDLFNFSNDTSLLNFPLNDNITKSVPDTPKKHYEQIGNDTKFYSEESFVRNPHYPSKETIKSHEKRSSENRHGVHGKWKAEDATHETGLKEQELKPHRKATLQSEDTLFTSISDMIDETLIKDYAYLFPKKVDDKIKPPKEPISSSELIKNTQDMLQAREEKRIKREEDRSDKKKKAQEARDKKTLLREETKKQAQDFKRAAEDHREQSIRLAEISKLHDEKLYGKLGDDSKRPSERVEKERTRLPEEKPKYIKEKNKVLPKEDDPSKRKKKPTKIDSEKMVTTTEKPKVQEFIPKKLEQKGPNTLPEKHEVKKPPSKLSKVKDLSFKKFQGKKSNKIEEKNSSEKSKGKELDKNETLLKESPEKLQAKKSPSSKPKADELTPDNIRVGETPPVKLEEPTLKTSQRNKTKQKEKNKNIEIEPTTESFKEPIKKDQKEADQPNSESKVERSLDAGFRKLIDEQAKIKEQQQKLQKREEEEAKKAREIAEKKLKEDVKQPKSLPIKPSIRPEIEKPKTDKKQEPKPKEELTTMELNFKQIHNINPGDVDLILKLVKMKKENPHNKIKIPIGLDIARLINDHKRHKYKKEHTCVLCANSDIELDLESIANEHEQTKMENIIIGPKVFKYKPPIPLQIGIEEDEQQKPVLFRRSYKEGLVNLADKLPEVPKVFVEAKEKRKHSVDQEPPKCVIRYALSDRSFIEKGWTMLPTEKVVRKMNVYRMRPAHPEFDWFEHNRSKRLMTYDTGGRLAEFDDNGRGRWYYKNGRLALDYYDAEEMNAQQRFVVYSSGEPDERGRSRPITVLATFDYLGNGVVFDHSGKIRLKYNQTEGVVLDRAIGPVSHWKWHTLNDPPVLQQVMVDTKMPRKDPEIMKLGGPGDTPRPDNEDMLAIEFDNFIKEKSKKLTRRFKPFQIKMKALKINENFSLKVLDQATVYLIFRDGSANLRLNVGMVLDHKEIVDTDTAELGEVPTGVERLPARTASLARLQGAVAHAQRVERLRIDRERRLRPAEPCASADRLAARAARPRTLAPPGSQLSATASLCRCRKQSSDNLYYDSRLY